jgi:TolA-binding protein
MTLNRLGILAGIVTISTISLGTITLPSARADDFAQKHPRRAEVNKRNKNQRNQVKQGEANGSLTQKQANHIDRQENQIKNQERRDERKNEREGKGDTLTKGQQNQLNREQNHTEGEIQRDERRNTNGGAPAGGAPAPAAPAPAAGQ